MVKPTRKGTPQGGVISPLLANIVLNHLDWTDLPPINWASEKVRILAESLVREKEVLP